MNKQFVFRIKKVYTSYDVILQRPCQLWPPTIYKKTKKKTSHSRRPVCLVLGLGVYFLLQILYIHCKWTVILLKSRFLRHKCSKSHNWHQQPVTLSKMIISFIHHLFILFVHSSHDHVKKKYWNSDINMCVKQRPIYVIYYRRKRLLHAWIL